MTQRIIECGTWWFIKWLCPYAKPIQKDLLQLEAKVHSWVEKHSLKQALKGHCWKDMIIYGYYRHRWYNNVQSMEFKDQNKLKISHFAIDETNLSKKWRVFSEMPDLNILSEFIPDLIGLSVDVIICGVLYKVYSGTLKQISAIKVTWISFLTSYKIFEFLI